MGHSYVNTVGKLIPERCVKPACPERCVFECRLNFNSEERLRLHKYFWSLNNVQKNEYISQFVERISTKRTSIKNRTSRRLYTYVYYFEINGRRLQVCKIFFTNTLDFTDEKIYWYFNHLHNEETGKPYPPNRRTKKTLMIADDSNNTIKKEYN